RSSQYGRRPRFSCWRASRPSRSRPQFHPGAAGLSPRCPGVLRSARRALPEKNGSQAWPDNTLIHLPLRMTLLQEKRLALWGSASYLISGTVIAATRLLESAWPKEGSIIAGLLDAGHFMVASFCIAFLSWVGELVRVGRPWLGWIAVG